MFYVEQDNKIVLFDIDREKIQNALVFMPQYQDLEIQETDRPIVDFEWADTDEYKERKAKEERERIMELKMTPLDFLKALEQCGITYDMVKQFMEENPLIERELRFCQNVYRKHPMLQALSEYGITSEILDTIFKKANGEEV